MKALIITSLIIILSSCDTGECECTVTYYNIDGDPIGEERIIMECESKEDQDAVFEEVMVKANIVCPD